MQCSLHCWTVMLQLYVKYNYFKITSAFADLKNF